MTPNLRRVLLVASFCGLAGWPAGRGVEAQIHARGESELRPATVVRGQVRAVGSEDGLPDAFVAQVEEAVGAFTNEGGAFELTLPVGVPATLLVGRPGYETVRFELPDSVLQGPLVLLLPAVSDSVGVAPPALEDVYRRMASRPREGETLVTRLEADAIEDEGRTAVDVILAHVDESVDRCSNGSICSSSYGGVRGLVRAREIFLCIDGRWANRRRDVIENLFPGVDREGGEPTQVELLDAIPAAEIHGAEILLVDVPPTPRPWLSPARGRDPVQYRVHIYTRGFMATNLARDAVQLPLARC